MSGVAGFNASANWRTACCQLTLIVLCLLSAGCVQRRLTVRSNPPGALVYVDNQEIGTTPVSTDFIYYGTRQIRLVKDGFETLTILQPLATPWYDVFPLDFVSENLVPGEIRDERMLEFTLVPQVIAHGDQLLQRAEDLRRGQRAQVLPPQGPAVGPVAPAGPVLGPAMPENVPLPVQPLPSPLEGPLDRAF